MKRRFGFTLIELLVVVAIIALLVSILMPALGRARELANQVKCGTQLNGIGKAIALYVNDYKEAYPQTTPSNNGNGYFFREQHETQNHWWWNKAKATDSTGFARWCCTFSNMYLLIKYEDLVPNMFLCPSADGEEMDLQDAIANVPSGNQYLLPADIESWADLQCFNTGRNCSYSMHDPYKNTLDASSTSSMAVMADANPCVNPDATSAGTVPNWTGEVLANQASLNLDSPDWADENNEATGFPTWRPGNSPNHDYDCQNVLFADSHVKKDNHPTVGIQDDNIYTYWDSSNLTPAAGHTRGIELGLVGTASVTALSQNSKDSYLAY
ncbi:MAG: type II secretion system protein [Sedimentisphaerales bacterium]|nr:type II secretion system protein [Sedimentisphaerales bacterium]